MRDDSPSTDVVRPPVSPPGLLDRDGLITPYELAAFLQVPVRTLGQWRYLGSGPESVKVGRHVRYRPADVRSWLATGDEAA